MRADVLLGLLCLAYCMEAATARAIRFSSSSHDRLLLHRRRRDIPTRSCGGDLIRRVAKVCPFGSKPLPEVNNEDSSNGLSRLCCSRKCTDAQITEHCASEFDS